MCKKILLSIWVLVIGASASFAQDIHFSQWYLSPLTTNPALAGSFKDIQVVVNYRDQWRSVGTPFKTYGLSVDGKYKKKSWERGFLGYGLNVFSDKAGDAQLGTTQVNLSLAYHVFLAENMTLGAGLQGGFAQKSINTSKLQWGNQYDGTGFNSSLPSGEPAINASKSYVDFSGGLVWSYGVNQKTLSSNDAFKATAGLAYFHVNQPNQSFYGTSTDRLYSKIVFHAVTEIGIQNTNGILQPSIYYAQQGPAREIIPGLMIKYLLKEDAKYTGFVKGAAVSLGGYYRAQDAFILSTFLEVANYALGISYDINTSSLREASAGRGGFEICLRYINPSPFSFKTSNARFN